MLCFSQAFEEMPWFVSVIPRFSVRENVSLETIKDQQLIMRRSKEPEGQFRVGLNS